MKVLRAVFLWLLFLGLYLLLAASIQLAEVMAGALASALVTWLCLRLRENPERPLAAKAVWLRPLLRIPWSMFQESWLLLVALWHRLRGREVRGVLLEWRHPGHQDRYRTGRAALATFGVCITPNSYLVHHDREKGIALVRQLVGKELSEVDRTFLELP